MTAELNEEPYFHVYVGAFDVEGDHGDDLKIPLNVIHRGSTNRESWGKKEGQPCESRWVIPTD